MIRLARPLSGGRPVGFTLMEILLAMALFSILGLTVVTLLGQGMSIFEASTADTSMQDRLQAVLPQIREDVAAIQPVESYGMPPPPATDPTKASTGPTPPPAAPTPPANRMRAGTIKMADVPTDQQQPCPYVAFVRTNALEVENPVTRNAGSGVASGSGPPVAWEPATDRVDMAGNLLATGGLMEVAYVAIPDDLEYPGILTLYRCFRAPIGTAKTLLDPANLDTTAKVKAAGRPIAHGVIHFGVTFRNVFAKSWQDGWNAARVGDGQPYVGTVWDSTRGLEKTFPLFKDATSVPDVSDDVFPALARIDLTLAEPGVSGFGGGETTLQSPILPDDVSVTLESVGPLLKPGPDQRWLKIGSEWMGVTYQNVDSVSRKATVTRGQRSTLRREHRPDEQVYVGSQVTVDVPLVYKDRYARRR